MPVKVKNQSTDSDNGGKELTLKKLETKRKSNSFDIRESLLQGIYQSTLEKFVSHVNLENCYDSLILKPSTDTTVKLDLGMYTAKKELLGEIDDTESVEPRKLKTTKKRPKAARPNLRLVKTKPLAPPKTCAQVIVEQLTEHMALSNGPIKKVQKEEVIVAINDDQMCQEVSKGLSNWLRAYASDHIVRRKVSWLVDKARHVKSNRGSEISRQRVLAKLTREEQSVRKKRSLAESRIFCHDYTPIVFGADRSFGKKPKTLVQLGLTDKQFKEVEERAVSIARVAPAVTTVSAFNVKASRSPTVESGVNDVGINAIPALSTTMVIIAPVISPLIPARCLSVSAI